MLISGRYDTVVESTRKRLMYGPKNVEMSSGESGNGGRVPSGPPCHLVLIVASPRGESPQRGLRVARHHLPQPRLGGLANLATGNAAFSLSWLKNADWLAQADRLFVFVRKPAGVSAWNGTMWLSGLSLGGVGRLVSSRLVTASMSSSSSSSPHAHWVHCSTVRLHDHERAVALVNVGATCA